MQNDKQQAKEAIRKLIASALCDLIAYMGSVKDPFIVGGQYSNDKLIEVFHGWLFSKKFDINGVNESTKTWVEMYQQNMLAGSKEFITPPTPKPTSEPPLGPLPPMPPKSSQTEDTVLDDGYYNGEDWKSEENRPKKWTDEGEQWKEGNDDDDENLSLA